MRRPASAKRPAGRLRAGVLGGPCWGALAAAALLCALAAAPSYAHRQHVGITTVSWTAEGRVEVVHKFTAHDIEPLLGEGGGPVVIADVRSRAQAALYVAERFDLATGQGEAIPLTLLGAERTGQDLYVYQEGRLDAPPERLRVRTTVLFEALDDQRNRVNVEWADGARRTADLTPSSVSAVVSRDRAS